MKKQKQLFLWILGLLLMLFTSISTNAANPTYACRITNEFQRSCNVIEFDVTLARTGSTVFQLAQFQLGILMNPAFIPSGGIVTVTPLAGSSQLQANQIPGADKFNYVASTNCIIVTPVAPPGAGNGMLIPLTVTKLFTVRVSCSLPFVTGQTPFVASPATAPWNFSAATGYYATKMFAYKLTGSPATVQNVDITVVGSHSTTGVYNTPIAGNFASPVAQHISTSTSQICLLPGAGASITVDATQNYYSYYLYHDGNLVMTGGNYSTAVVVFGNSNSSSATFGSLITTGGVISVKSPSCSVAVNMQNTLNLSTIAPLDASITISASPGTSVPPGTSVTFTASPINGGSGPGYQ